MAAGTRFRPVTLAVLVVAMAAGIAQAVHEWRDLWAERHVGLSVTEVVRLPGGRAVVVLEEEKAPRSGEAPDGRIAADRSHGRRLPVPVTAQAGTAIERRLRTGGRQHSLAARAIDALGSCIVRVAIDVDASGGLSATLIVRHGLFGSREVPADASEAIGLAVDEGAPIETSRDLLDVAGISEEEARTLALDAARGPAREAASLPVHSL